MNTAQIAKGALSRYFPSSNKLEVGYQHSTLPRGLQINTDINNLTALGYPQRENPDAVTVYVSSRTAPNIYKHILLANEIHHGYEAVDDLEFSNVGYLGISECRILACSATLSKASVFCKPQDTAELSSYLLNIYALEREKHHRAASKVILQYIETHFAASDLAAVNALLEAIDINKLSQWSIAGLIRFTGRARSHLPFWSSVFNRAKIVLTEKGYNAEKLLAGISG